MSKPAAARKSSALNFLPSQRRKRRERRRKREEEHHHAVAPKKQSEPDAIVSNEAAASENDDHRTTGIATSPPVEHVSTLKGSEPPEEEQQGTQDVPRGHNSVERKRPAVQESNASPASTSSWIPESIKPEIITSLEEGLAASVAHNADDDNAQQTGKDSPEKDEEATLESRRRPLHDENPLLQLEETKTALMTCQLELEETKAALAASRRIALETKTALAASHRELEETQAALTSSRGMALEKKAALAACQREFEDTKAALTASRRTAEETKTTLVASQRGLEETKAALTTSRRTEEETKTALVAYRREFKETKAALATAQCNAEETKTALATTQRELEETKAALTASHAKVDETKVALAASKAEHQEIHGKYSKLKTQYYRWFQHLRDVWVPKQRAKGTCTSDGPPSLDVSPEKGPSEKQDEKESAATGASKPVASTTRRRVLQEGTNVDDVTSRTVTPSPWVRPSSPTQPPSTIRRQSTSSTHSELEPKRLLQQQDDTEKENRVNESAHQSSTPTSAESSTGPPGNEETTPDESQALLPTGDESQELLPVRRVETDKRESMGAPTRCLPTLESQDTMANLETQLDTQRNELLLASKKESTPRKRKSPSTADDSAQSKKVAKLPDRGWTSNVAARAFMEKPTATATPKSPYASAAGKANSASTRKKSSKGKPISKPTLEAAAPPSLKEPKWNSRNPKRAPPDSQVETPDKYKYQEVVRSRDARQAMPGHTCPQCDRFVDVLLQGDGANVFDRKEFMCCSRHRAHHSPQSTPPGFWDLSFVDEK